MTVRLLRRRGRTVGDGDDHVVHTDVAIDVAGAERGGVLAEWGLVKWR